MRSIAPALLPIFRSKLQADLLAAVLLRPDQEHTLSELAQRFEAPLSTLHGEVKRLADAGLLVRRNIGRSVLVRANSQNRLISPLTELLVLAWGPQHVVSEEFTGLTGADLVLIFGSWAARYLQEPGPPPNDLDVLVVGEPRRGEVYDAADRAQRRLEIPVNPVIRPDTVWQEASDPLVQQIQSRPYVVVVAPEDGSHRDRPKGV